GEEIPDLMHLHSKSPGRARSTRLRMQLRALVLTLTLGLGVQSSDQAAAALECDIAPRPIERDDESVAEADQEIDVGHAPQHPGDQPGHPEPAELRDRARASDGGERAVVAIAERRRGPAFTPRDQRAGHILALLLGDRSDARQ